MQMTFSKYIFCEMVDATAKIEHYMRKKYHLHKVKFIFPIN